MSSTNNAKWELSSQSVQNYINDVSAYENDSQERGDLLVAYTLGVNRRRLMMLHVEICERQNITLDMVQKFEELVASSEKLMYLASLDEQYVTDTPQDQPAPDPNQTVLFA